MAQLKDLIVNGSARILGKIYGHFEGMANLTGTPTAPTAAKGTNTTQIATTAFVQSENSNKNYVVTVTNNNEDYIPDKTFDEISAALNAGNNVILNLYEDASQTLPQTFTHAYSLSSYAHVFTLIESRNVHTIIIWEDAVLGCRYSITEFATVDMLDDVGITLIRITEV